MREEVNKIYEEVKSSSGYLSIFGFRVAAGGSGGSEERVETSFESLALRCSFQIPNINSYAA